MKGGARFKMRSRHRFSSFLPLRVFGSLLGNASLLLLDQFTLALNGAVDTAEIAALSARIPLACPASKLAFNSCWFVVRAFAMSQLVRDLPWDGDYRVFPVNDGGVVRDDVTSNEKRSAGMRLPG